MRIHSDTLTNRDLIDAANIARVEFDRWQDKGSRQRDHAFDVTLFGESRRRPNSRGNHGGNFAATWDQWGVFLAVLFDRDPDMVTPYYDGPSDFHYKTDHRFDTGGDVEGWWPHDAHGDHTWGNGGFGYRTCTKCSAMQRWM